MNKEKLWKILEKEEDTEIRCEKCNQKLKVDVGGDDKYYMVCVYCDKCKKIFYEE